MRQLTGSELVEMFDSVTKDLVETVRRKNSDYAGQGGNADAFANFKMIEAISGGSVSTEIGMITRMTDKLSRIISLETSGKEAQVKDEAITDTLKDLAAYSILLYIYKREKQIGRPREVQAGPIDTTKDVHRGSICRHCAAPATHQTKNGFKMCLMHYERMTGNGPDQ